MRAIFAVHIAGTNVTSAFQQYVSSIQVSDRAGQTSDTATIELDDKDGQIVLPSPDAPVTILLGWEGQGIGAVFSGVVDEISARGDRSGRMMTISAKGMDTRGPAKEPLRMHLDDTTIGDALQKAGEAIGFSVEVDADLAGIGRDYIALDDESLIAFGERIAREVGGVFKIAGDKAVLAKRNGGRSASGAPLGAVTASWGVNLHSYDIAPILGRNVDERTAVRFYDRETAEWKVAEAETGTRNARTVRVDPYTAADEETAEVQADANAEEADRKSGEGTVVIEGNIAAQPEGQCEVTGCRPGIDGTYRIEGVDHNYSRSGWTTTLELRQPKGGAGEDGR